MGLVGPRVAGWVYRLNNMHRPQACFSSPTCLPSQAGPGQAGVPGSSQLMSATQLATDSQPEEISFPAAPAKVPESSLLGLAWVTFPTQRQSGWPREEKMLLARPSSRAHPWSRPGEVRPAEWLGPGGEQIGYKWEMHARQVKEQITNSWSPPRVSEQPVLGL